MTRAWLLLSFGDDRQYAGNPGYLDEPRRVYQYDSFVPNHKQVAEGDYVLIRDHNRLQGVARIQNINAVPGEKRRFRCPECRITALKERKDLRPRYRCNNSHEFDDPIEELAPCISYSADFGTSFIDTPNGLSLDVLRSACPRHSGQLAIQEIYWEPLFPRLAQEFPAVQDLSELAAIEVEAEEEFVPPSEDTRKAALRLVRARQGQRKFREGLIARYGARCLISGCDLLNVLEAAHIDPYRGKESNHPENGLLLRADLHTLFDLDLLGIEPETLVIRLHPEVFKSEYEMIDGRSLLVRDTIRPGARALRVRWLLFQNRTNSPTKFAT